MSKCGVIISGGHVSRTFAKDFLEKEKPEVIIGVDSGLCYLYHSHTCPTHIVGDFDSVPKEVIDYYRTETSVPIRTYNPVKDATDTEIAIRHAIELGVKKLWVLGATGTRIDHVFGNIQSLKIALDAGIEAYIIDEYNRIRLLNGDICLKKEDAFGTYFSVFPLGGMVEHFSISGAKYPLCDHTLSPYDSLCVSNQIVDEEVCISFSEGTVILMESTDNSYF